jgi:hypothetical protein
MASHGTAWVWLHRAWTDDSAAREDCLLLSVFSAIHDRFVGLAKLSTHLKHLYTHTLVDLLMLHYFVKGVNIWEENEDKRKEE